MEKSEIIQRGLEIYSRIEPDLQGGEDRFVIIQVETSEFLTAPTGVAAMVAGREKFGLEAPLYLHRIGQRHAYAMR
ncbi:MAG TPA: hypothetical protein PLO61_09385 [Fimbriimonadaceae bacterium]|nr:hypothetical protein [Fimbriimonadaceae bacterium]HRJ33842.1 hypothetical protein [Fimbriimonadaceae bacterium]